MRKFRFFLAHCGLVSVPVIMLLIMFGILDWPWYAAFWPLVGAFMTNGAIASIQSTP